MQVLNIQPGKAPPKTPYKRKNVCKGPIHMNPLLVAHHHSQNIPPLALGGTSSLHAHATLPMGSNVSSESSNSVLTTPYSTDPDGSVDKSTEDTQLASEYLLLHIYSVSHNPVCKQENYGGHSAWIIYV